MREPGSKQLIEQILGSARPMSKPELTQIVATMQKHEAKIVDWCQYGQPDIDGACAQVQLPELSAVPRLIEELLKFERVIDLDIFPEGTPVPDLWRVGMRVGSARHR